MTINQTKQCMWAGAAAATLIGVGVLAWSLLAPVSLPDSEALAGQAIASGSTSTAVSKTAAALPTLQELRTATAIDLRRPLKDQVVTVVRQQLKAKLRATAYEPAKPQESMALMLLADGSETWLKAGQVFKDAVGEVTVKQVTENSVKIEYQGVERELAVPSP